MTGGRQRAAAVLVCTAALLLGGCSEDMSDLRQFVEKIKQRPGGKIEPLPEFEPYKSFAYDPTDLRNPFRPRSDFDTPEEEEQDSSSSLTPDWDRPREPLEQYPLDSLAMVGTLSQDGKRRGLVRDPDGIIHRVVPGNHIGQNFGRIVTVEPDEIRVIEIAHDGRGGWMERDASLAMNNDD